nr:heavy metal translocating P-type ATPase [Chloroflexota bacterium]
MDHTQHNGAASQSRVPDPRARNPHSGHDKHAGHDPEAFRRQFWIVLVLTIPVVIWSAEVQDWLGYHAPSFIGSEWIPPLLGTAVFLYGGWVFLK